MLAITVGSEVASTMVSVWWLVLWVYSEVASTPGSMVTSTVGSVMASTVGGEVASTVGSEVASTMGSEVVVGSGATTIIKNDIVYNIIFDIHLCRME